MASTETEQVDAETVGDLQLLVIGAGAVAVHRLPSSGQVTIGRMEDNQIIIDDSSVSRKHAVLRMGQSPTIEDLGSVNGTRVGGTAIEPRRPASIRVGEAFELGTLMLVVQRRPPGGSAPPRRIWEHGLFEERLEEECARAWRSGGAFVLVHLDCDRSLPSGEMETVVSDVLRAGDVLGRYGPGEYEALLVDTDYAQAEQVVQRLAERFSARGIAPACGLACYPRDGRSPAVLVEHAARAIRGDGSPVSQGAVLKTGGAMEDLHRLVERIAGSNLSILILGESGVGKEVLAETVHRLSPRSKMPFVRLNCAALSESLLESELFGHEKGAFTGAIQSKPGLFETAEGGTIFIDEVGELPISTQVKLLRVIEDRKVLRVGGLALRDIDMRFISATNRNLEKEVERQTFRLDLYYRLNGVSVVIPPLRERLSEIDGLVRHFLSAAAKQNGLGEAPEITPDAVDLLMAYHWPGNIRELRNMMERAVLLCEGGQVTAAQLPTEKMRASFAGRAPSVRPPSPAFDTPPLGEPPSGAGAQGGVAPRVASREPRPPVAETQDPLARKEEKALPGRGRPRLPLSQEDLEGALERCGGNQKTAAEMLGISRRTLISRLEELAIPRPRKGKSKS